MMKFNECMSFLKELNKFNHIYLIIEGKDNLLNEVHFDDVTIAALSPFEDKEFDLSYDGLHDGEEFVPRFKMTEYM